MVVDAEPPTLVWYMRSTICVGVMAEGHGIPVKSNSIKIRLSPVPRLLIPSTMLLEFPRLTVALESISTSGTEGNSPVYLKMEPA